MARAGTPKTALHRQQPGFRKVTKILARRVSRARAERGWTIEQAAEHFGIEPAHVRRIEGEIANPSLAVLCSVARGLGLTVSELLAA